jgi:TP901 family phage tail tape measure protein
VADYNLGTARGKIEIDSSGAEKASDEAARSVGKFSKDTEGAVNKVANTSGVAGAAIAAGIGAAVNAAANFEQRMSAVEAVSGASAGEMKQLSDLALQLGKDTSFSATEAASAIEELVKAGVSVPDVMNGAAQATVALAAAGEVSLPEAAELAANAMNSFGLSASEMPKVADLIAGAANASAISVGEFRQSLQQVGAVAHLAGASFEDTATAIALMGNAGIKGSDAGTSLKTMLSNLQPGTKKQTKLFKELGLITADGANQFYDAQGNLKSLAEVSGTLQNALKGMTAQQKQATLEALFGSDAIRAAAILTEQGAAGFNKMADSMKKVTAAEVAATRMDNLKGQVEALKGSLETAAIVMGQVFIPMVRKVVEGVTKLLNAFLNLPAGVQKVIVILAAVVAGMLLTVAAIVKITQAVRTTIATFKILTTAVKAFGLASKLAFLTNPVFLIIAAIALLVVGIVLLWKKSETFRNIVTGVWNAVKAVVSAVVNWITGTAVPALVRAWHAIVDVLKAVGGFFKSIWDGMVDVVTAVVSFIAKIIITYVKIWLKVITTVLQSIFAIWAKIWGLFGPLIKAVWNLILQIIRTVAKLVMLAVATQVNAILKIWTTIWGAVSKFTVTVWTAIKNFIIAAVRAIWGPVSSALNTIKNGVVTVFNAVVTFVRTVWGAIRDAIVGVARGIWGAISGPVGAVRDGIVRAFRAARDGVANAIGSLRDTVGRVIDSVVSKVRGIQDRIVSIFSGAARWLYNAGSNIIQGLIDGITSKINVVTDKLKKLTDMIPDVKGPERRDKRLLQPAGKLIMEGFIGELQRGIAEVRRTLGGLTGLMPTFVPVSAAAATGGEGPSLPPGLPGPGFGGGAGNVFNFKVYNPVTKSDAETLSEEVTRMATLGVL